MNAFKWVKAEVPRGLEVRQVYGFIFSSDGRILLLEDEGQYNLPGGKPENSESINETLIREALEEGQVVISSPEYLGYQFIEGNDEYAQVRLVASMERILPSASDPSTGRHYSRLWVPPILANDLLTWGVSGDQQLATAIAAASIKGVSWGGTPLEYIDISSQSLS